MNFKVSNSVWQTEKCQLHNCVTQFTCSISTAFILDNFGDEPKYGTARERTLMGLY